MRSRVGIALIALGAAIFLYQAVALLSNRGERTERSRVLTGSIDQMAGTRELRPAASVVGVGLVAGGIFLLALSGEKRR